MIIRMKFRVLGFQSVPQPAIPVTKYLLLTYFQRDVSCVFFRTMIIAGCGTD